MIIMWKQILQKDFKFLPDSPTLLGMNNIAEGPFVNLAASPLKNISEQEQIELIMTTLSHEGAHQAFSTIEEPWGAPVFKIGVLLFDYYQEIMLSRRPIAPDTDEITALIGESVGKAIIDELFAHEAGAVEGKGPQQLYLSGYHVDVSREFGKALTATLNFLDERVETYESLMENADPSMRSVGKMMIDLHNKLLSLLRRLQPTMVQEFEELYRRSLITIINRKVQTDTADLSDRNMKIILNALMEGRFKELDTYIKDKGGLIR